MRRVDGRAAEPRAMAAFGSIVTIVTIVTPRLGRALQRERRRELGPPGGGGVGGGVVRRGGRVAPMEVVAAIAIAVEVVAIVVELVAHRGEQRRVVPPVETKGGGAARETHASKGGYSRTAYDHSWSDTRPRHSTPRE